MGVGVPAPDHVHVVPVQPERCEYQERLSNLCDGDFLPHKLARLPITGRSTCTHLDAGHHEYKIVECIAHSDFCEAVMFRLQIAVQA